MRNRIETMRNERGFTLIELLIVIVILGILAAVVVVAVGNINQNAQTNACDAERKNLVTSEEAYFANNDAYANEATLVANGQLTEQSAWFTVHNADGNTNAGGNWSAYTIVAADATCA